MASITDGIGSGFGSAGIGRREPAVPSTPDRRARFAPAERAGTDDVGTRGALGRLFEARVAGLAGAKQIRQLDRRLEQTQAQLSESRVQLQQFKLYPPYPIDEPKRAQAIREFNGLAEEIERLTGHGPPKDLVLPRLAETAGPGDADVALGSIEYARIRVDAERATLVASVSSGDDAPAAAQSAEIAGGLADASPTGLSRSAAALLRQIF